MEQFEGEREKKESDMVSQAQLQLAIDDDGALFRLRRLTASISISGVQLRTPVVANGKGISVFISSSCPAPFLRLVVVHCSLDFGIICNIRVDGKLVKLAILMMVARKKLINPFTTIRKCIVIQLDALTLEASGLMKSSESNTLAMPEDKKAVMTSALQLLDAFEGAGDALEPNIKQDKIRVTK
ncbi:hypothetical protein F0562_001946 [Nyssa sinensis]|uniref:Uncharacterized protein n=1 Tax=Nyssa sinensis TaxID=561372 RepID=A0A5J5C8F6_9ASTE|nr:hypothetical protein F0562_001946 [Nyssa sinensis]